MVKVSYQSGAATGPFAAGPVATPARNITSDAQAVSSTAVPGYYIDAAVEVFSKSFDAWLQGSVRSVRDDGTVHAEFMAPDGRFKEKFFPFGHPELRLATEPTQSPIHQFFTAADAPPSRLDLFSAEPSLPSTRIDLLSAAPTDLQKKSLLLPTVQAEQSSSFVSHQVQGQIRQREEQILQQQQQLAEEEDRQRRLQQQWRQQEDQARESTTEMDQTAMIAPMGQVIASAEWVGKAPQWESGSSYAPSMSSCRNETSDVRQHLSNTEQTPSETTTANAALEAARAAEEAKVRLEAENADLRARYEALQAKMEQDQESRESMTKIADRVDSALARLDSYKSIPVTKPTVQAPQQQSPDRHVEATQSTPQSQKTLPASPRSESLAEVRTDPGSPPMMVSPYAGPLHGLYILNLPAHPSVHVVPPFSQRLACEELLLSEDAYTIRRGQGCSSAVAMGSAPLERQAGGLYFEVRISGTIDGNEGGLGIGITHTSPHSLLTVSGRAEEIPSTVVVGYSGYVYLNGCERPVSWNPAKLEISQRIGLLITDDGRGDLVIFEDQIPVVCIDGFALRDAGMLAESLYPVVELYGATSGVTLVPRAILPPGSHKLPPTEVRAEPVIRPAAPHVVTMGLQLAPVVRPAAPDMMMATCAVEPLQ